METTVLKVRRPIETKFNQQRLPILSPLYVPRTIVIIYLFVGTLFIVLGIVSNTLNSAAIDYKFTYDGVGSTSSDCAISDANEGKECIVSFTLTDDLPSPIYVYYQLENFYSNHRDYVASFSQDQLTGTIITDLSECSPLEEIVDEGLALSPCGVIANTIFNDIFTATNGVIMDETGIAWSTDHDKFSQPKGFVTAECYSGICAECLKAVYDADGDYTDCGIENGSDNIPYAYWYPNESTTQYLYETFPEIISPLDGVKNEHFMVWMRVSGLRDFRRPYGKITGPLYKDDVVTFVITNNYLVTDFEGSKSIVLSHLSGLGASNSYWATSFITMGILIILMAVLIMVMQLIAPRSMGDTKILFDS